MKLAREDLARLRLPIAAALVLAALGAAAITFSDRRLAQELSARKAAQEARLAAQKQVSQVSEEEREIRENLVHYRKLLERGMVGPERRLDWIDAITAIKNTRKLYEIRYQIDPQRPIDYSGIGAREATGFMMSRMKLEMQLLHEEDLLNFLSDLGAAGNAHVSVRSCAVTRSEPGTPSRTLTPKLSASCVVDLITLREGKPA